MEILELSRDQSLGKPDRFSKPFNFSSGNIVGEWNVENRTSKLIAVETFSTVSMLVK